MTAQYVEADSPGPELEIAHRGTITAIRQETPTTRSFLIECGDCRYLPGQWLKLQVPLAGGAAVGVYSIASSPWQAGVIQLVVKQGQGHPVTRYLHEGARVGDRVRLSSGQGSFCYRAGMGSPVVLIGAGAGVAPLLGILRYIDRAEPSQPVALVYSVPTPEEFLFADELRAMAERHPRVRLFFTVTRPEGTAWSGRTGRIDRTLLEAAGADPKAVHFICGPNAMVDASAELLASMGIPSEQVVYEKWW